VHIRKDYYLTTGIPGDDSLESFPLRALLRTPYINMQVTRSTILWRVGGSVGEILPTP